MGDGGHDADDGGDGDYADYGAEDYGMPNAPGASAGGNINPQLASLFNSQ